MQSLNISGRRIRILYILFFAVVAAALALTITSTAFQSSLRDARKATATTTPEQSVYLFGIENDTRHYDYDILLEYPENQNIAVRGRVSSLDAVISANDRSLIKSGLTVTANALFAVSVICYIFVFVVVFIILNNLRKGIKSENIFIPKNTARCRIIGVLLIAASVFNSFYHFMENRYAASILTGSNFTVDTSLKFSFIEILAGILILFIAEVFSVGQRISSENKLTI